MGDETAGHQRWDRRYAEDDLPWDTGRPDTYLVRTVSRWPVRRGTVLDVGCGTGTNTIWLARQGFDAIGLDISARAVEIARERSAAAGVSCRFLEDDFLRCPIEAGSCLFVFDRGCFHAAAGGEGRAAFARRVASCLQEDGLWLSLVGNADDRVQDKGPPRLTAREITMAVEPVFKILDMEACLIESRMEPAPRFWKCLYRRR